MGYLNIGEFLKAGSNPKAKTYAPEVVEELVAQFQKQYAEGYTKLPRRLALTAELWAGIEQNWDDLNSKEQQQLKDYFHTSQKNPIMDESTYKKLLALTPEEAADWRSRDQFAYNMGRLEALGNRMMMYQAAKYEIDVLMGPWWYYY